MDINRIKPSLLTGRRHDMAYWTILLLASVLFLVMNVLTTYKEDDMGFALIDGVWAPVRSLADALQSYCNHFVNTNGRLADAVPTLFAGLLGKGAFNLCNTLVFALLAHLLSLLSVHRRSITVLVMFLAFVGCCYPVPGETMLWMAGSANYMWAITLSLLLIYWLQRQQGKPLGWARGLLLFLGAAVAGGFNEATSFGFFAGLLLYYLFNRRQFDRRAAVALAGYLAGLLLIVASPAAWERAADGGIVLNLGLGDLLSSRWYIFHEKLWTFYVPLAAVVVGLIALLSGRGREVRQCVWTYVFLALTLVLFALGIVHERAYAPWATVAFIIVAMGVEAPLSRWPWLRVAAIVVALALGLFTFARGIKVLRDYKAYDDQTVSEIVQSSRQTLLRERQFDGYSRFIKPMNFMSTNFFAHEQVWRSYYGKDNVQFVSDSVFVRVHEGRLLDGASQLPIRSDHPQWSPVVYTFPNQDYIAIKLNTDSLPCTFQTARYYSVPDGQPESAEVRERRLNYGIDLDYEPRGFYPMMYQGHCYLIGAALRPAVNRIVFPMSMPPAVDEMTISIVR